MKTRFSTIDLMAAVAELQQYVGMRVNNVYDVDSKTYLIRLMKPESKVILMFESGTRLHTTEFDWPKSQMPSGFSMKLRKHIKQKRLEAICLLGIDRIVDMTFGSGELACHVIVELYDRGNVVLTDFSYLILNILRPRTDKTDTDVRFAVREIYPVQSARPYEPLSLSEAKIAELIESAKPGDNLRKLFSPIVPFGPALIEHSLMAAGIEDKNNYAAQLKSADEKSKAETIGKIQSAMTSAQEIFDRFYNGSAPTVGVITTKSETRLNPETQAEEKLEIYQEFHPQLYLQHSTVDHQTFDNFNAAVDQFFSHLQHQKSDLKQLQQERSAMGKLETIRVDHMSRLSDLQTAQMLDARRAELIELNQKLVDRVILVCNTLIANQTSWEEIGNFVEEAKLSGDPVASCIKSLKLESNRVSILLTDPFASPENEAEQQPNEATNEPTANDQLVSKGKKKKKAKQPQDGKPTETPNSKSLVVEIDLGLGSHANARKFYDMKRTAATKERKTTEASKKALKSAEQKTKETLKAVAVKAVISKSRRPSWFEKFLWFITSENYLVIGGRDQQQNELLVKRYLRPGDIYVHADIRGAASVIVKNPAGPNGPLPPPKTLNEAGTMAVCYSAAWEAKVLSGAWWVAANQVSKTAPTGEFLTTGSFMIRGKKNFLAPAVLAMGFSFVFKLAEDSMANHIGERTKLVGIETESVAEEEHIEEELNVSDSDSDDAGEPESTGFPNVEVRLGHLDRLVSEGDKSDLAPEEISIVQSGKAPRIKQKKLKKGGKQTDLEPEKLAVVETTGGGVKRGQKAKLKKIREKYGDQDDEERQIRMELLASKKISKPAGSQKSTGQIGGEKAHPTAEFPAKSVVEAVKKPSLEAVEKSSVEESNVEKTNEDSSDESETEETTEESADDSLKLINSFTGQPLPEDELMFAIPICAPYASLQSYKFRVKLTPGTGKRGKATKLALATFLRDKSATQREKDLLKSAADADLARNLPGKVRVSAPQLVTSKKK